MQTEIDALDRLSGYYIYYYLQLVAGDDKEGAGECFGEEPLASAVDLEPGRRCRSGRPG